MEFKLKVSPIKEIWNVNEDDVRKEFEEYTIEWLEINDVVELNWNDGFNELEIVYQIQF